MCKAFRYFVVDNGYGSEYYCTQYKQPTSNLAGPCRIGPGNDPYRDDYFGGVHNFWDVTCPDEPIMMEETPPSDAYCADYYAVSIPKLARSMVAGFVNDTTANTQTLCRDKCLASGCLAYSFAEYASPKSEPWGEESTYGDNVPECVLFSQDRLSMSNLTLSQQAGIVDVDCPISPY